MGAEPTASAEALPEPVGALACRVTGAPTPAWLLDNPGTRTQNRVRRARFTAPLANRAASQRRTSTWHRVSFPGDSARASLKRDAGAKQRGDGRPFPGDSARASLKPRRHEVRATQPRGAFPGDSARASLKRAAHHDAVTRAVQPFPGDSARASLKPGQSREPHDRAASAFPGDSARASLKRREFLAAVAAQVHAFPGDSARASLKRHRGGIIARPRAALSRAIQPGPH